MAETLFQGLKRLNFNVAGLFPDLATRTPPAPEDLRRIVEDAVIPKLLGSRDAAAGLELVDLLAVDDGSLADALVVHQLARLALQQKHVASMELLGELHARGVPRHELYTRYLTPAARLLGEEWRQDRKDFTQVTLGTAFLQQLLREVSLLWNDRPQRAGQHHRILLLPVEGEQHTFGISVLGELFHDAGWDVCGGPRIGRDELSRLVAREHLDAVGFSISSERMVEPLARQVEQVRRHARSSALRVLVGGGLVWREPALFSGMDVDRISAEGGDVVELAQAAVRAARA